MKSRLFVLLALGVLPSLRAAAQTADTLARARALYDSLAIERAVPLLRAVISPSWPYQVTAQQRAVALEYLGATFGLADATDSAIAYFRAALQADPFADLDPRGFTPAQIAAFRRAQEQLFAVGVRPVAPARVALRTERVSFTVLTTHAATLDVRLRTPAGDEVVFVHDSSAGTREVSWDFLLANGTLAPAGRYELTVRGESRLLPRSDSVRAFFDLAREGPALADTLPELGAGDLLPIRYSPREARGDLATGAVLAGGALALGGLVSNSALGHDRGGPALLASAALVTAVVTVLARRHHPELPAHVSENARRRADRAAANGRIRVANAARLNRTVMIVTPATGAVR